MEEYITKHYYADYMKHCSTQLSSLNRDFHANYKLILMYKNLLDYNYNKLVTYRLSTILDDLLGISSITFKKPRRGFIPKEDIEFLSNYDQFILLINDTNSIIRRTKQYSFMMRMPFTVYRELLLSYGREVSHNILTNEVIKVPTIGKLKIVRVPYNDSKPDWQASLKFKKYLEDNGITPMSKEHPDGKAWLIGNGLGRKDFWLLHWNKSTSKVNYNKTFYRFVCTDFDNNEEELSKTATKDEVINSNKVSLTTKLYHMYRNLYDECRDMFEFVEDFTHKNLKQ